MAQGTRLSRYGAAAVLGFAALTSTYGPARSAASVGHVAVVFAA